MKKKQWTMQEDFIFPENAGLPAGAETVGVTPMFTEERTEDAVRLTGIYHIAANVVFDEGDRKLETLDSVILIDDVDLEGKVGYFEYAVPLHIDLPAEVGSPLQVVTTSATNETDGQGSFSVVWDVECSYKEAVAQAEEPVSVALAEEPSAVAEKSTASAEKPAAVVEKTTAIAEEAEQIVEADAPAAIAQAEVEETEAVAEATVAVVTSVAINDSTSYDGTDEALSFIAGLEDGVSTTLFRSNDILLKNES